MEINSTDNLFYIGNLEDPLAKLEFNIKNNTLLINSVEVTPQLRGQGIAADLVEKALEYSKVYELEILPICSYAKDYILKRDNNDTTHRS